MYLTLHRCGSRIVYDFPESPPGPCASRMRWMELCRGLHKRFSINLAPFPAGYLARPNEHTLALKPFCRVLFCNDWGSLNFCCRKNIGVDAEDL